MRQHVLLRPWSRQTNRPASCETVWLQLNRYVLRLESVISLSSGLIAAVALAYMAIMFAIAFWGDRRSASLPPLLRAWVYSLSLSVYGSS